MELAKTLSVFFLPTQFDEEAAIDTFLPSNRLTYFSRRFGMVCDFGCEKLLYKQILGSQDVGHLETKSVSHTFKNLNVFENALLPKLKPIRAQ